LRNIPYLLRVENGAVVEVVVSTCIKNECVAQQVGNTVDFTIVEECLKKNGWTMEEWTEARLDEFLGIYQPRKSRMSKLSKNKKKRRPQITLKISIIY
jgi:hypothetical protein